MMKFLAGVLLLALPLAAQTNTQVSGTDIHDAVGCPYQNGTVNFNLVSSTGQDISTSLIYIGTIPFNDYPVKTNMDSHANFTVPILANTSFTAPASPNPTGTQYLVTVCSQPVAGNPPPVTPPQRCFNITTTITGSTQDLTSALNAAAAPLGCGSNFLLEVNGTAISPPSPANFINSSTVNFSAAGNQISASVAGGLVTTFTAGNLSPIFTTSVATPTTTPALSFALSNAQTDGFLGNVANSTGPPSYTTLLPGSNVTLTPATGTPNTLTISATGGTQLPPPFPVPAGQAVAWAYPTACIAGPAAPSSNGVAICGTTAGFLAQYSSGPLANCCWTDTWSGFTMPTLPGDAVIQGIYGVEIVQHQVQPGTAAASSQGACGAGSPSHGLNTPFSGINYGGEWFTASIGTTTTSVTTAVCNWGTDSSLGPEAVYDVNNINQVALAIYYTTANPPSLLNIVPIPTTINLETAGVVNSSQSLLNIAATSPITVSNSSGTTTIACSTCVTSSTAPFNSITSGTNTAAAMLVGTGASLGPTGSGTIQATNIASTIAAGTNVTITGAGTVASPYSITASSTASTAFSALTGSTNTTAAMVVGTGASLAPSGTGTIQATNIASTITAGSNVTITGSGTTTSPYSIASTGGGGCSSCMVNITPSVTVSGCTVSGFICTVGTAVATVSFSSIPAGYSALRVIINGRSAGTTADLNIQFNGDTGAHYDYQVNFNASGTTLSAIAGNQVAASYCGAVSPNGPTNAAGTSEILIPNYSTTTFWKQVNCRSSRRDTTTLSITGISAVTWENTAAITSILFVNSATSNNFVVGSTFSIYGIP